MLRSLWRVFALLVDASVVFGNNYVVVVVAGALAMMCVNAMGACAVVGTSVVVGSVVVACARVRNGCECYNGLVVMLGVSVVGLWGSW